VRKYVDYAKAFDHVDHCLAEAQVVWSSRLYCAFDDVIFVWPSATSQDQWKVLRLDHTSGRYMPQGSYLGPLIFIILIDNLRPGLLTHKSVDDTTVSETEVRGSTSAMQSTTEALIEWSQQNHININCKKTKEMIIRPLNKDSVTPLSISSVCWMRLDLQAVGRYAEVGRSYWRHYDQSSKETSVPENTQAGRCNV